MAPGREPLAIPRDAVRWFAPRCDKPLAMLPCLAAPPLARPAFCFPAAALIAGLLIFVPDLVAAVAVGQLPLLTWPTVFEATGVAAGPVLAVATGVDGAEALLAEPLTPLTFLKAWMRPSKRFRVNGPLLAVFPAPILPTWLPIACAPLPMPPLLPFWLPAACPLPDLLPLPCALPM